jgi:hypothetical protein
MRGFYPVDEKNEGRSGNLTVSFVGHQAVDIWIPPMFMFMLHNDYYSPSITYEDSLQDSMYTAFQIDSLVLVDDRGKSFDLSEAFAKEKHDILHYRGSGHWGTFGKASSYNIRGKTIQLRIRYKLFDAEGKASVREQEIELKRGKRRKYDLYLPG